MVRVCLWTSLATVAAALIVPLALFRVVGQGSQMEQLKTWLWLVPASAFMSGMAACGMAVANRFAQYRLIAKIQVASTLVTLLVSIAMGALSFNADGLLAAYVIGQIVSCAAFSWFIWSDARSVAPTSHVMSLALLRRHRRFPIYTMPTVFIEQVTANVPVYAMGYTGEAHLIGLFNRTRTLLNMPLALLGTAVTPVLQEQGAKEYARAGTCRETYVNSALALIGTGIVPALLIVLVAPSFLKAYLGPNWADYRRDGADAGPDADLAPRCKSAVGPAAGGGEAENRSLRDDRLQCARRAGGRGADHDGMALQDDPHGLQPGNVADLHRLSRADVEAVRSGGAAMNRGERADV
jgi:O-antigen/teichoic acid export membrane protein